MTEKLYYIDSHLTRFTAQVLSCDEGEGKWFVTLDRTAFYPEGGGQPADKGILGGVNVLDVHEKNGEIVHYTDAPISVGTVVEGQIDWQRRFDLMQQHSGEHIVSGLIHEKYGYENVGFHMGADTVVIDFSGELTMAQLREIEYEANRRIWQNYEVEIAFYRDEALDKLSYRSKKALTGDVRIVTFPHADVCACCGTHVKRTGEIGCIRLLNVQKLRGGVRVEMLSGERCYRYFDEVSEANHINSVKLSVPERNTAAALERLMDENSRMKYRMAELENRLFENMAEKLEGAQLIFEPGLSPDSVRKLCVAVMEKTGEICAVFSGDDEGGYKYALGKQDGDLRAMVKEMNGALRGRGGGKPFFAQGNCAAGREEIEAFFAKYI